MTNAEKYLTVSTKEFKNAIINTQGDIGGLYSLEKWLDTEVKPTLTEDERVILRNLPKEYETIGKCKNGILYVTTDRKIYLDRAFGAFFNHLFQFIKERRRIRDSRTFERRINNV